MKKNVMKKCHGKKCHDKKSRHEKSCHEKNILTTVYLPIYSTLTKLTSELCHCHNWYITFLGLLQYES